MKTAAFLLLALVAAGCGSRQGEREDLKKKQEKILRDQSSKWTEEQKKFEFPDLNKKPAPGKTAGKGDPK